MKVMSEEIGPFIYFDLTNAPFSDKSQTYDVTYSTQGMFYDMFLTLQEKLNFTATLHKRKDSRWGVAKILDNGTVIASGGIIEDVALGDAEMIVASMAQTASRIQVLDILPSIMPYNMEIFIKKLENEEISWTVYLNPISRNLWTMLIFVAIVFAVILSSIEKLSGNYEIQFTNIMVTFWIAFKANFGGKPSKINAKNNAYQIGIFICLLAGSIFWIAYRASLTSELSVVRLKPPFNNLESLLKSDYRLISPPKSWAMSLTLINAEEGSIWAKLYQKKMDEKSFFAFEDGARHIINKEKVAYLQDGVQLRYFDEFNCKITSVWTSPTPFMYLSMYMKKKSRFTPFVAYALKKMAETGIKDGLSKRHVTSEPDCKPLHSKGRPLGFSFFTSLFVVYFCVVAFCLIILIFENIVKPKKSQRRQKLTKEMLRVQLCDKIDDFLTSIQKSQDINVAIDRRKAILLMSEVKCFIK